jgi:sugar lactone lactonase YvrE
MKITKVISLAAIVILSHWPAGAQIYDTNSDYVQTFAGSGFSGYVDGVGQLTMFNNPSAIVTDSSSNLFVWDNSNRRIRKIAPDGTVTTFAGGGFQLTGVGTNVLLPPHGGYVGGMAIDHNNTIWLCTYDQSNGYNDVLAISSNGAVTSPFITDGALGVCADSSGNIYLSASYENKILRYSTNGALSVFAGSGNVGYADGNGIFTAFNSPQALAADAADNIYVWDSGNHLIRRIDQSQNVTTIAGFSGIWAMCVDDWGNVIIAWDSIIAKMTPATNVVIMAGSFSQSGYTNGPGNLARFNRASGVCVSGGTVYVADSGNQRIRSITNNPTTQPVLPANLQLNTYPGLQIVGTVGRTYQVQASPDMSNWTTRTTMLLTSSPYLWIDQNPVSGNKFYRAFLLP